MNTQIKEKIKKCFEKYPEIKLGYYFGSQVEGRGKPLSDHDFAIYLDDSIDQSRKFEVVGGVIASLMQAVVSNKIDLVVLNDVENIPLKFKIHSEGLLIYQIEPYKVTVGSRFMSAYHDFQVFNSR